MWCMLGVVVSGLASVELGGFSVIVLALAAIGSALVVSSSVASGLEASLWQCLGLLVTAGMLFLIVAQVMVLVGSSGLGGC